MWRRRESAASEAPRLQVCPAAARCGCSKLSAKTAEVINEMEMPLSGCVWPPSIVVENWSAVALRATSSSPWRKIRSVKVQDVYRLKTNPFPLTWTSSLLRLLTQEYVVMNLDSRLLSFPLYVCCNFLYTSPHSDQRPDPSEQESAAPVS